MAGAQKEDASQVNALPGMELIWKAAGAVIRTAGKSEPGRQSLRTSGRWFGRLAVSRSLFGMKKPRAGAPATEVVRQWSRILDGVGAEYEVVASGPKEVEVEMLACPAGLTSGRTCEAGMEADRTIVRELGGHLEVIETIAQGAPRCRMKVVVK